MTRKLHVLLAALICTVLFAHLSAAQEEPRTKPSKERPAVDNSFSLKRSCQGTPKSKITNLFGKRPTTPSFLKEESNSCYGWCNCSYCECWYDEGDLGCCFDGCFGCWDYLDGRGACGTS